MGKITETATWREDLYQLEVTDPDLAGEPIISGDGYTPASGHMNIHAKLLGDRTQYLKYQIEQAIIGQGGVTGPANSINNEVALFDGLTGSIIKGGGLLGTAAFTSSDDYATPTEVSDSLQEAKDYTDLKIQENSVDAVLAGMVANDVGYITSNTVILQSLIDAGKPIYLPQGIYYVDFLTFPASLIIYGDGQNKSILSWPQANMTTRGNMLVASGDVNNLILRHIGLRGNRTFQTTPTVSGHDTVALFARAGSVQNVDIRFCSFSEFGDESTTGAPILIGSLTGTNRVIQNIRIINNTFTNISNVPGVYINGDATYHSLVRDIYVDENIFNVASTALQNCIYILGGSLSLPAHTVSASRNSFNISAVMDTCIEFNFVSGGKADNNNIYVTGIGDCGGILLREGIWDTTVHNNVMINEGTACINTHAIASVRLTGSGVQDGISILGNTVHNWGISGTGAPVAIASGSINITVNNNMFAGKSATAGQRTTTAISVAGATQVDICNNMIRNATYGILLGPVARMNFEGNTIYDCGDGAVGIIVESAANQAITNLTVKNNRVRGTIAGTPNFVSVGPAVTTGNRVEHNDILTLNPVNPSYRAKFLAIVTPASTGTLLAGSVYTFSQGAISIADADGFTIGANLDGTLSGQGVALGNTVIVSANVSMKGCLVYGYVDSTDVIRIRVQNETGASVSVDAATWKVIVIKS